MPSTPTVVFVCEHGAAKSVIAAVYLRQLAAAGGTKVRALARGTDPEPALSPIAVNGLEAEGLPVPGHIPQRPTSDELGSATTVVSFGPSLEGLVPDQVPCLYWRDVPAVSDGFEAARDAIVARLNDLVAGWSDVQHSEW